jgi:hypothetical protein
MKVIGVEIDNNRAIFFALEEDRGNKKDITNNFKHLKLYDDKDNSEIQNFQSIVFTHFDSVNPDRIAILSRQGKGPYASSSISFKIEALIQCYSKRNVEFVSPQGLTAFYKKNDFDIKISHNYQEKAAKLANSILKK